MANPPEAGQLFNRLEDGNSRKRQDRGCGTRVHMLPWQMEAGAAARAALPARGQVPRTRCPFRTAAEKTLELLRRLRR